jgi:hypothetical protein
MKEALLLALLLGASPATSETNEQTQVCILSPDNVVECSTETNEGEKPLKVEKTQCKDMQGVRMCDV